MATTRIPPPLADDASIGYLASRPRERAKTEKSPVVLTALALAGVVFIVYQSITWARWLNAGPRQITEFRDTDAFSWKVAIFYQSLALTAVVVVGTLVVRECFRRRALTFDAMLCITGLLSFWLDATANVFQPLFLYSSQWINLNDWTGYMPGMVNPDASRMPESFLFTLPIYIVGLLVFAKLTCGIIRFTQRRWPSLPIGAVITIAFVVGFFIDIALEYPIYAYDLWAYPGSPDMFNMPGLSDAHRFPILESLIAMMMFGPLSLVYYFRDDTGRTCMERGLSHHGTARRMVITQLRLVGFFNGIMVMLAAVYWITGLHSQPYPEDMKPYIVNNACDAPGYSGTRYGPCPGSPDYRMPLRDSLPAPAAGDWVPSP